MRCSFHIHIISVKTKKKEKKRKTYYNATYKNYGLEFDVNHIIYSCDDSRKGRTPEYPTQPTVQGLGLGFRLGSQLGLSLGLGLRIRVNT